MGNIRWEGVLIWCDNETCGFGRALNPIFEGGYQQDSHEFLRTLLGSIEKAAEGVNKHKKRMNLLPSTINFNLSGQWIWSVCARIAFLEKLTTLMCFSDSRAVCFQTVTRRCSSI